MIRQMGNRHRAVDLDGWGILTCMSHNNKTFLGIQEFDGFGAQHEPKCQSTRTQKGPQSQSS